MVLLLRKLRTNLRYINTIRSIYINQIQIDGKTSSVRLQEVDAVVIALEDTILSVAAKLHAAPPLKVFNPIFSLEQDGERILTDKIRSRFNTTFLKNCNLSQMKSEFSGGIFQTIRIPKIIPAVQRSGPRELEAETSQEGRRPQDTTTGQPKPEKKGEDTPSGRASTPFVRKETERKDAEALIKTSKANLLSNTKKELYEQG
ncbi:hypothetical protein OIU78_005912 [Salix suchowensis]|nr:hypothetical protein OIU78_005912 [Salix suchowensis]